MITMLVMLFAALVLALALLRKAKEGRTGPERLRLFAAYQLAFADAWEIHQEARKRALARWKKRLKLDRAPIAEESAREGLLVEA